MLKNLKKYIPKRKYRERSQLERRKNLGQLEKKQDYKIRAEDFHKKEARYKKLKEEARLRNPEEFYFKMANSKTFEGEHIKIKEEQDMVKKLGVQHKLLNLVNFKKSVQEKEKEKLITDLSLAGTSSDVIPHKIFLDNEEELIKFRASEYFETDEKLLSNKTNRLKTSQLEKMNIKIDENEIKKQNTFKKLQMKKLSEKIHNIDNLDKISNTLMLQKELIKSGKRRKMDDGSYKFFNERKK
jgi:U3 small nucleolar RNA-associated protein 11